MQIKYVDYVGSFPKEGLCPKTGKPEYAFIGRSNVGKSSLINMLTGRIDLARVSKKPGKTQMLNYYLVNDNWYLVDLPGYGYAKISKKKRQEWEKMISNYLQNRTTLQCACVLVDANVPPQKIDIEFINWLGELSIPFIIIYTKADRLNKEKLESNVKAVQEELMKYWNDLPQQFITSSSKKIGGEGVLDFIEQINEMVM